MLAEHAMLAPRLVELRRILKANRSCNLSPLRSGLQVLYLKILMDAVFGVCKFFAARIVWRERNAQNKLSPEVRAHLRYEFFSMCKRPDAAVFLHPSRTSNGPPMNLWASGTPFGPSPQKSCLKELLEAERGDASHALVDALGGRNPPSFCAQSITFACHVSNSNPFHVMVTLLFKSFLHVQPGLSGRLVRHRRGD
jgi:hypothetical protein